MGKKGSFLAVAAAAVGDKELKWRRFLSGSLILPIDSTPANPRPTQSNNTHIINQQNFVEIFQKVSRISPNQSRLVFETHRDHPIQSLKNPNSKPHLVKKVKQIQFIFFPLLRNHDEWRLFLYLHVCASLSSSLSLERLCKPIYSF